MLNGYKTFVVALVSIIGGLLTMMGVTVSPETLSQLTDSLNVLVGAIITIYGLVMALFRAVTTSPMFNRKKEGS